MTSLCAITYDVVGGIPHSWRNLFLHRDMSDILKQIDNVVVTKLKGYDRDELESVWSNLFLMPMEMVRVMIIARDKKHMKNLLSKIEDPILNGILVLPSNLTGKDDDNRCKNIWKPFFYMFVSFINKENKGSICYVTWDKWFKNMIMDNASYVKSRVVEAKDESTFWSQVNRFFLSKSLPPVG